MNLEFFGRQKDEYYANFEIYELLMSFTDFLTFKDLILAYKDELNGKYVDLKQDLRVTKIQSGHFFE